MGRHVRSVNPRIVVQWRRSEGWHVGPRGDASPWLIHRGRIIRIGRQIVGRGIENGWIPCRQGRKTRGRLHREGRLHCERWPVVECTGPDGVVRRVNVCLMLMFVFRLIVRMIPSQFLMCGIDEHLDKRLAMGAARPVRAGIVEGWKIVRGGIGGARGETVRGRAGPRRWHNAWNTGRTTIPYRSYQRNGVVRR